MLRNQTVIRFLPVFRPGSLSVGAAILLVASGIGLGFGRAPTRAAVAIPFKSMHRPLGDYFGLGTYIAQRYPQLMGPSVNRVRETGVHWVREEFTASHLHNRSWTKFRFDLYDPVVARERAAGLHILGLLDYNNSWVTKNHTWMPHSEMKTTIQLFDRYVDAVVRHYRNQIDDWQIWNEPDLKSFWHPGPRARDYAHLLTSAYTTIKQANPSAQVVIAGPSGRDKKGIEYLHKVVRNGGRFDILAYQPYVDVPTRQSLNPQFAQLSAFHKPVWFSEVGWAAQAGCRQCGRVGMQAGHLATLYLLCGLAGINRVFWYDLRDDGLRSIYQDHFGLLEWDLGGKLAYQAYEVSLYFLNESTITGEAHLSPTLLLYRLERNGRTFYVLWNDASVGTQVHVSWGLPPVQVLTYWGKQVGKSGTGGIHTFVKKNQVEFLEPPGMHPPRGLPAPIPIPPGHTE